MGISNFEPDKCFTVNILKMYKEAMHPQTFAVNIVICQTMYITT